MSITLNRKVVLSAVIGLLLTTAGFVAGYNYKAYEVRKALTEAFGGGQSEASDQADQEIEATLKNVKEFAIGQEVSFSTQKFKVNSAKSSKSLSSQYSGVKAASQGSKFIIVELTVTNTTNAPFIFENYILFDDKDRAYNSYSDTIGYVDNYLDVRDLAPGVPQTGVVVYEVPDDSNEFRIGAKHAETNETLVVKFTIPQ